MRITVWDAALRCFHWALAILVVFSFVTGTVGGGWMAWHLRSGYAILALVVFRVAWGLAGSETARFTSFVRGPAAASAYARDVLSRRHRALVGHNPLGGWMVVFMLLAIAAQAASGLFADDEIATQGPLAVKVSNAFVARMSTFHHYNQWVVAGVVAVHVLAIAVYWKVLRSNLVKPMLDGRIEVPDGTTQPRMRSSWLALVLLVASAAAVYGLVVVYPATP